MSLLVGWLVGWLAGWLVCVFVSVRLVFVFVFLGNNNSYAIVLRFHIVSAKFKVFNLFIPSS